MDYFPHDTTSFQDEKISQLYMEYGFEGVGLFYVLLEKLALQEKPIKTDVLKKQLHIGKRLEKCWLFMHEIGIICSSNGETFNERMLSYTETFQKKRKKNTEKVSQWRVKQEDIKDVTGYVPVRNPTEENRIEESIVLFINQELPKHTLESAEHSQMALDKNPNTDFVKEQWKVFLSERANDTQLQIEEHTKYPSRLHQYFLNWIRNKHPKKQKNGAYTKSPDGAKIGTSEARNNKAREW